jgi:hypothetical protein
VDFVFFNLHPSAAPISLLATGQVVIDLCNIHGNSCRRTFNNGRQTRAMGLACGKETEHGLFILLFVYRLLASAILPLVETENSPLF